MYKYYISKVFQYLLVLWVVLTLNFFLPRWMPEVYFGAGCHLDFSGDAGAG